MTVYIKSWRPKDKDFKTSTLFFYHKSVIISESFDNWIFTQNLKRSEVFCTKIAGNINTP